MFASGRSTTVAIRPEAAVRGRCQVAAKLPFVAKLSARQTAYSQISDRPPAARSVQFANPNSEQCLFDVIPARQLRQRLRVTSVIQPYVAEQHANQDSSWSPCLSSE